MNRHFLCVVALLACLATPALADDSGIIAIESRTLTFVPSRDDLTVGTVWFNVYSSRPTEVKIDGAAPANEWHHLELAQVGKNQFALPALTIEHADGLLCLSVKAWFNEVGNQYDSWFYVKPDDRYALVAFSTHVDGPDWERARPRFSQNRVATLREFMDVLARPFTIALNQRPLADVPRDR